MTLEQIVAALKDRRIDMVSEATGLHYQTVMKVRNGDSKNPSNDTMRALEAYLEGRKP